MPAPLDSKSAPPLLSVLRDVPLFHALDAADLERVSTRMRRRSYRPNVALFTQGDEGGKLYVILSGSVHIQRDGASGRTLYLGLRGPGEHFGEMAMLEETPRMADAVTATDCDLVTLDRASFQECLRSSPEMALAVMTAMAGRLREAADRLESRHELDVTGRLAEFLLQGAKAEGQRQPDGTIRLPRPRTHEELAEVIGTTRESVTRALDDLRAIKTLRTEGRPTTIVILDAEKLAKRCVRL